MENCKGNYVCIKSEDLSDFFDREGIFPPITGKSPPEGDYHCTIMYSLKSDVDPKRIQQGVDSTNLSTDMQADIIGYECFDSRNEDGEIDGVKSCIVILIESENLDKIHDYLKSFNLIHSYAEFKPHVTLRYGMDVDEAHYYRDVLNRDAGRKSISLSNLVSQAINKNYV